VYTPVAQRSSALAHEAHRKDNGRARGRRAEHENAEREFEAVLSGYSKAALLGVEVYEDRDCCGQRNRSGK
jgi:hypothetical protein